MRRSIFFFVCFFTVNITNAQFYSGIGMATKSTVQTELGVLVQELNTQLSAGFIISCENTSKPNILYLNTGYRIKIDNDIKITATPSLGIGWIVYDNPYKLVTSLKETEVININHYKAIYALELGKEVGIGRFYINYTRAGSFGYFGIGIKAFFRDYEYIGYDPTNW